ncbi:MAG: hypothetical protein R2752_05260 [Vicinamibacterales bacterium]
MPTAVHYLPLLTTILSILFATSLYRRWAVKHSPHLWWWAVGITTYGLGTALESAITLGGNSIWLTKAWYIAGALLGGYPLAQGSLYLSWPRRFANRLTAISVTFVVIASLLVIASPVNAAALEPYRPSGAILGWTWVRLLTPFINLYAVFFLIGGAVLSAWRHYRYRGHSYRAAGNALIALGALLPGIGGSFAKAGVVEALYVGECVGIMVIWLGDRVCARQDPRVQPAGAALEAARPS